MHAAIVTMSFLSFLSIGLSLLLTPKGANFSYQFISDNGLNTYFSSFLLCSASVFMFATYTSESIRGSDNNWNWLVLSIAFAFLSIDEIFQVHEQIGSYLTNAAWPSPFSNWTDLMPMVYGIVAIPMLWIMMPKLLHIRSLPELLAVAFLFYLAHTLADALVRHNSEFTHVTEESLKLFSSTYLALAGYASLIWTIDRPGKRRVG